MRIGAEVLGVAGGLLSLTGAVAALLAGGPDTVVIGGWITVGAALLAALGGVAAGTRARLAALLMGTAAVAAGLVCPGVIPAIANSMIVFFAYVTGIAFIVAGAVLAWRSGRTVVSAGN